MKYNIEEALNLAIMSNTPLILVEGINDEPIYTAIAQTAGLRSYEVKSANYFDCSAAGGCFGVLACVQQLQNKWTERSDIDCYFLAFLDADFRPFKVDWTGIQALHGLFVLEWYAIEAYFIAPFYIRRLLTYLTRLRLGSPQLEATYAAVTTKWQSLQEELCFFALAALQNELQPNNSNPLQKIGQLNDTNAYDNLLSQLKSKQTELTNFAQAQSLNFFDTATIKRCLRSKDLIIYWLKALFCDKEQRFSACGEDNFPKCENCQTGQAVENCHYKYKSTKITDKELKRYLMEVGADDIKICPESFSAIIMALQRLAA